MTTILKTIQSVELAQENLLAVLRPNTVDIGLTGEAELHLALQTLIQSPRLREIVKPGEKIVIIASDMTRPQEGTRAIRFVKILTKSLSFKVWKKLIKQRKIS